MMTLEKTLMWLRELHEKSWKTHPKEYSYNTRRPGWVEELKVSEKDGEKALQLLNLYKSQLLFEPGSGTYGFGVSIAAYEVIVPTYPNVPYEVKHIITLTSKQLFPEDRRSTAAYEVFASFTHTEENKAKRKEVGREDPLKDYSYYDY